MARRQHISRLAAPRTWPIKKKGIKWITKPSPGPHKIELCMPLVMLLRDVLRLTHTTKESHVVLGRGTLLINGQRRTELKYPVGLFDVVSIPSLKKHYRVLLSKKGKLMLLPISESEAKLLPLKIRDKTMVPGGRLQLNFSNGWNMLIKKDTYTPRDVILFDLKAKKALKHIKMRPGVVAYVTSGRHVGQSALLVELKQSGKLRKVKLATLEASPTERWETTADNIFPMGEKKSEIKLE